MPAPLPTFLYGTAWKEDRTAPLVELALREGFRGIDTANQRRHYFEAGLGEGLAAAYRAGLVTRADLFLQTKFTYQRGQDHRLPYDPAAKLSVQVAQSMASSLEHLATDYVDSFVLHGPSSGYDWTDDDGEVWEAMRKERDAGRTRHSASAMFRSSYLQQMASPARCEFLTAFVSRTGASPAQGGIARCEHFAAITRLRIRDSRCSPRIRRCCQHQPLIALARKLAATPAQVVFSFARAVGMRCRSPAHPATKHMKQGHSQAST